jgi:hypothetical protein
LGIRRIAILNIPEEMHEQIPPIEVHLRLINRGGSAARIIEGNVTFSVDEPPTRQNILRREQILPPFDIQSGMPKYTTERDAAKNAVVKSAETYNLIRTVPPTTSVNEAANLYLALHRQRNDPSIAFHLLGYFKYRTNSWVGSRQVYYTAFCRRFEQEDATFVPTNDADYEYED